MKLNFKILAISLILLCCLMGAASAADDVSTDVVSDSVDDVAVDAVSDDASVEEISDDIEIDENIEEQASVGSEPDRASSVTVTNWGDLTSLFSPNLSKSILGSSNLGDWDYHDEIYVNVSSENDPEDDEIQGSSWEDAYGTYYGLIQAFENINNDGRIYVADGIYEDFAGGTAKNCTVVGMNRENTIFQSKDFTGYDGSSLNNYGKEETGIITYVNITFKNPSVLLRGSKTFINCTFINTPITTNKEIYEKFIINDPSSYTIYWKEKTFDFNFTECNFVDYSSDGSVLEAFTTSQVNFNNCKFENVTANSILKHTGDFIVDDSINFKDCTFNNVNVKGIVDVATGTTFGELYSIEGCTGVESYGIVTEGDCDYVNSTEKAEPDTNDTNDTPAPTKLATKLTAPKVTATYNVAKKLVITLTDKDGKALANKKVTVKVGTISKTLTTNAKGQVSLNVATLVPKTYTATVKFAGDNDYLASSVSPKVVVSKAKPKLSAKAKTFKAKAKTKKFTATLKNNKGKVMKKVKLTIKVGKKTFKATTNSKGKATFKIKLTKKGKYNAKIKFAGNKYYKALSKKVKITIK